MPKLDIRAYLDRIAVADTGPPGADALAELHRAHVERVPYETVQIHLGHPTSVDPFESAERIIRHRQGGYCFHLNGAFAVLLEALGYRVTWHRSGVQARRDPEPVGANANHLGLIVHGLPAEECPDGRWMVDVGLGDALYEPIPLRAGSYRQGPFTYTLRPSDVERRPGTGPHGWRLDHDPRGVFIGVDFAPEPARVADFEEQHQRLSTSPDSSFVRVLTAQRRHAKGVDALRGCVLTQLDGESTSSVALATARDWFDALADIFGLTLDNAKPAERDALWHRVRLAHETRPTPTA